MNTVTVTSAIEPHLVTTVTNNTSTRGSVATANRVHPIMVVANGYSAGVPTLVTNGMIGGGQTNPAGPQLEEEDKLEVGMIGGEDSHMNLLNSSPDEHVPLLKREQPPAESKPLPHLHHHHQSRPGNIVSGRGSNSNNNNNTVALGSDVKIQGLEVEPERLIGPEPHLASPATAPVSNLENKILPSGPAGEATSGDTPTPQVLPIGQDRAQGSDAGSCLQRTLFAEPVLTPRSTRSPQAHLVHSATTVLLPGSDSDFGSANAPEMLVPGAPGTPASQAQDPVTETSTLSSKVLVLEVLTLAPEIKALKASASDPEAPVVNPKASCLVGPASENPAPNTQASYTQDSETTAPAEASSKELAVLQSLCLLRTQMGLAKAKRPERPCSLDLSSSCISSGESSH